MKKIRSSLHKVTTYSDGGARGNPGPAAFGIIAVDEKGEIVAEDRGYLGPATNNTAEYRGIIGALELARKLGASEVEAFLDSEVVVRQLTGIYRVREDHLRKLFEAAKKEERNFDRVSYNHVPRTHPRIKYVDGLVNKTLDEVEMGLRK